MGASEQDLDRLTAELEQTRAHLQEALETIEAIRSGRIDAIVGHGGGEIFRVSQSLFSDKATFDQYRLLLDSIGDGAVIIVPEGTIVYCNRAFTVVVRKHMEDIVGADFREFLPCRDATRFEALLERARHETAREEVEISAGEGTPLAVELSLRFTLLGDVQCACMVVTDVTERKRNEERIRNLNTALEQRVARLIEASVDALLTTDLEFRITDANRRMTQLIGFGRDELIGTPLHLLAENSGPVLQCMRSALAQGLVEEFEAVLSHKNGQALPVAISARTFKDEQGCNLGIFVALRDVTERRLLYREHAMLASIIAASDDAIYSVAPDGLISSWNRGAEQMLGYTAAEIIGQSSALFTPLESRAAMLEHMNRAARDRAVQRFEARLQRKDHTPLEVSINMAPTLDRAGAPAGIAVTARDVSECRGLQRQLLHLRDAAVVAERNQAQILAGMGHQIRTTLATIVGLASLLLDGALTSAQQRYAGVLQSNATNVLDLISNVLDYSRLSAGSLVPEQTDFELQPLMHRAVNAAAGAALGKRPEIAVQIDPDVPRWLRGDPGRLRRVLSRLLDWAAQSCPGGATAVRVARFSGPGADLLLRFELILPESGDDSMAPRRRFVQRDGQLELSGGEWTDLPIVAELVRAMGGKSGVLETPGRGPSPWFSVPLAPADAASGPAPFELRLEGVPVLIVDDNASQREIMKARLASWKMAPETAGSAVEALRLLRLRSRERQPYALAVLDVEMPEMDGIELARQIRRESEIARTPLLLVTAAGGAADFAKRIAALDIKAVLLQPLDRSELRQCISGALASGKVPS